MTRVDLIGYMYVEINVGTIRKYVGALYIKRSKSLSDSLDYLCSQMPTLKTLQGRFNLNNITVADTLHCFKEVLLLGRHLVLVFQRISIGFWC